MNIKILKNSAKLVLASALAFSGFAFAAPAAQAVPSPNPFYVASISTAQNPNANTVNTFSLIPKDAYGNKVYDGVTMQLDLSSCGNPLASQVVTASPDGGKAFLINFDSYQVSRVGPSIEYSVTFYEPGFDPYQRVGSYSGYSVSRPSCTQINGTTDPNSPRCLVSKWSTKVSTSRSGKNAFIGGPATVSRTLSPNCRVKYKWTLNGERVSVKRTIWLKPYMRGKTLVMHVKVSKSGSKSTTKNLGYGRVRSR